jgi:5'-3' exonuclease
LSKATAYLVDSSIYVFRAWYSVPDEFSDTDGNPTNAVYGFVGFLCSLIEQTSPELLGLAFDESLTTSFRNQIYPEYKANREPAPVELKRQFAWCREIAEAMGLSCFGDPEFEADDIIGTLAVKHRDNGHPVCVVSSDKDLTQIVQASGDHWWDFMRRQKLDWRGIEEKFGVNPGQIADYLALAGDSVDNIPGVPGVGPKTAVALLSHFDTLDAIWERIDEVPFLSVRGAKSLHQRLQNHQDDAVLARKLTGLHEAVPSAVDRHDISRGNSDQNRLNELFDQLNFGPMLRRRCINLL